MNDNNHQGNDNHYDQEIVARLFLSDSRQTIYAGQYDAVLTMGLQGAVRIEDGIRHRHADYPQDNAHEARLAAWVEEQWSATRRVCVRAEPLVNGQRVVARVLLMMGARPDDLASLFHAGSRNGAAA